MLLLTNWKPKAAHQHFRCNSLHIIYIIYIDKNLYFSALVVTVPPPCMWASCRKLGLAAKATPGYMLTDPLLHFEKSVSEIVALGRLVTLQCHSEL